MSVVNLWVGAVTESSAWVRGRVSSWASVRLLVSEEPGLCSPAFYGPVSPTGELVASIEATDLDPDTRYWYAVEHDGIVDLQWTGSFKTHPVLGEPASYAVAGASCAGSRNDTGHTVGKVSNHPVFDSIRTHPLNPLLFLHLGDLHYRDINTSDPGLFRQAYDDVLTFNGALGAEARQGRLYRNVPVVYTWDDHCFGPNDSDRSTPARSAARQVYRERVPHYPLPSSGGGIYHHFGVGRVLFLVADVRSDSAPVGDPDGPGKTMLGADQLAWMEQVLTAPGFDAQHLVWVNPRQWMGTHADTWASYTHERAQLVDLFGDTGWLDRMCIVSGDVHSLAVETGTRNSWGGFPVYQFSSLDSTPSGQTHQYDGGPTQPGRGQYGTLQVHDNGGPVAVTGTGWRMGRPWRWHTSTLPLSVLAGRTRGEPSHTLPGKATS